MSFGLQGHIYRSLLSSSTADVVLRVNSESWTALYKLHRVVLIQAGFFKDLFTAGFSEASSNYKGHYSGPEELTITFDDLNITRAAFELCISRLYGGGPPLFVAESLIPSLAQPLTPPFSSTRTGTTSNPVLSIAQAYAATPPGQHPATPRFLLSLLATSIYLSIPSLAVQALNSILGSIGPYTIIRYLNFSLGIPMGSMKSSTFPEPEYAVGLENIADLQRSGPAVGNMSSPRRVPSKGKGKAHVIPEEGEKEDPLESSGDEDECEGEGTNAQAPSYHYGTISDKIGEASACWLARWAVDIVALEVNAFNDAAVPAADDPPEPRNAPSMGHAYSTQAIDIPALPIPHGRRRATTMSAPGSRPSSSTGTKAVKEIPTIWRRGCSARHNHERSGCLRGIPADWICAVLSSDTLFARGERERYDLARTVVDLRRREFYRDRVGENVSDPEEVVWARLFEEGIYYANMSLEEVMYISQDISSTTGRPFVPLAVLQAAHWSQSVLRHHITMKPTSSRSASVSLRTPTITNGAIRGTPGPSPRPTSPTVVATGSMTPPSGRATPFGGSRSSTFAGTSPGPPSSPTASGSELGIARTKAEITSELHFPIPGDSSTRFGDNGGIEGKTMDQLFDVSSSSSSASMQQHTASEKNYFGLAQDRWIGGHTGDKMEKAAGKASPYPPLRFGVEFWDVEALKERSRLHSQTIFYAGSLFNVYVQVVRKKGIQLGVYLHRQSSVDPIPPASAPPSHRFSNGERGQSHVRGPSLPPTLSTSASNSHFSPSIHPPTRSPTPQSPVGVGVGPSFASGGPSTSPTFSGSGIPATAPPAAPQQPFRDPRSSISAYFSVSCASATGASVTRFTSAPDVFAVSQSWGWKSSSLRTEEYLDFSGEASLGGAGVGASPSAGGSGKEVSLRATVVIGLV